MTNPARRLLEPSSLAPLQLDLRRVFWAFVAAWAVALVAVGVIAIVGSVEGRTVAICATGFALGFAALGWERRHARAQARRG